MTVHIDTGVSSDPQHWSYREDEKSVELLHTWATYLTRVHT